MELRLIRFAVAWCLLAVTLFYMLTGFGIVDWNIVSLVTLGILGKAISFQLHSIMWAPFSILLVTHVLLNTVFKKK